MRYLSLFTPAKPFSGPPSQEHMAQMTKLVEEEMKSGRLISTGGLKRRDKDGFVVHAKDGAFRLDEAPQADWMLAGGWAILQGESRDEVIEGVKKFLNVVGDGRCEVIEIFGG